MRRRIGLLLLAAVAALAPSALRAAAPPPHGPVGSEDGQRKAALASCAKCHQDVYAAWKAGPHSHSYEAAIGEWIKAYDPVSKISPQARREFQRMNDLSNCLRCHAPPRNMFEDIVDDQGRASFERFAIAPDDPVLTSGVDCMTCHASGGAVVTRADYKPKPGFKPPNGFCNPQPSEAFSRGAGCMTCHSAAMDYYADRLDPDPAKRVMPFVSCETCHMEADANGHRHHYYYWEEDSKKLARLIRPLFERFSVEVQRSGAGPALALKWPTDSLPHPILPATVRTYIVKIRVLNGGTAVYARTLRFFTPREGRTAQDLAALNPADELITLGPRETFSRSYALPAKLEEKGTVELSVFKKANFDYPDDDSVRLVLKRESAYRF